MANNDFDRTGDRHSGHTEQLFVRARSGDELAWEELVAHLRPSLERLFHGRLPLELRRRVDTHDLIQNGLARAAEHANRFEPRAAGSARAWLHTLLKNALTDLTREHSAQRRDTRRELASDELIPAVPDAEGRCDPSDIAEQMDSWARLLLQIAELPRLDAEIVLRHTLEDESFAVIAQATGSSSSTVKDRYHRSIRLLQRRNRAERTT